MAKYIIALCLMASVSFAEHWFVELPPVTLATNNVVVSTDLSPEIKGQIELTTIVFSEPINGALSTTNGGIFVVMDNTTNLYGRFQGSLGVSSGTTYRVLSTTIPMHHDRILVQFAGISNTPSAKVYLMYEE